MKNEFKLEINNLLKSPKLLRSSNILLIGDIGVEIITKIIEENQTYIDMKAQNVVRSIILINCHKIINIKSFKFNLLNEYNIPFKEDISIQELDKLILLCIIEFETKIIILEDINLLIKINSKFNFLELIKSIISISKISIVGTNKEIIDYQLNSNFYSIFNKILLDNTK